MLPCPYQKNFEGQNGDTLLKETLVIELIQTTEDFIMDTINQVEGVHYWQHQRLNIISAKEQILEKCRIGGTYFTSVAIIGGILFTRNSKNMNHVHKYHNDLV